MRGFIMVLLTLENTGLYENLHQIVQGSFGERLTVELKI